jgi:hypothetical protein
MTYKTRSGYVFYTVGKDTDLHQIISDVEMRLNTKDEKRINTTQNKYDSLTISYPSRFEKISQIVSINDRNCHRRKIQLIDKHIDYSDLKRLQGDVENEYCLFGWIFAPLSAILKINESIDSLFHFDLLYSTIIYDIGNYVDNNKYKETCKFPNIDDINLLKLPDIISNDLMNLLMNGVLVVDYNDKKNMTYLNHSLYLFGNSRNIYNLPKSEHNNVTIDNPCCLLCGTIIGGEVVYLTSQNLSRQRKIKSEEITICKYCWGYIEKINNLPVGMIDKFDISWTNIDKSQAEVMKNNKVFKSLYPLLTGKIEQIDNLGAFIIELNSPNKEKVILTGQSLGLFPQFTISKISSLQYPIIHNIKIAMAN